MSIFIRNALAALPDEETVLEARSLSCCGTGFEQSPQQAMLDLLLLQIEEARKWLNDADRTFSNREGEKT